MVWTDRNIIAPAGPRLSVRVITLVPRAPASVDGGVSVTIDYPIVPVTDDLAGSMSDLAVHLGLDPDYSLVLVCHCCVSALLVFQSLCLGSGDDLAGRLRVTRALLEPVAEGAFRFGRNVVDGAAADFHGAEPYVSPAYHAV